MIPSLALDTLAHFLSLPDCPLSLAAAETIALQRARFHPLLLTLKAKLQLTQTFKPDYDALTKHSFEVSAALETPCDVLLYLPTRQKKESQYLLARGLQLLKPGGLLLGCGENALGIKSYRGYAEDLCNSACESFPMHKCNIFWLARPESLNEPLLQQWLSYGEISLVEGTDYKTRIGTYGWNKVDIGSELLQRHFDQRIQGRVADFGSGYGYLGDKLLEKSPSIKELWLYEAEKLSLDCSRENLAKHKHPRVEYRWIDLDHDAPELKADWIITNPPCHDSGMQSLEQGLRFIRAAHRCLKPGGKLLMVANVTLPYEKELRELFGNFSSLARERGFKVLEACRS